MAARLCAEGQLLAEQTQAVTAFYSGRCVSLRRLQNTSDTDQQVVALHACGDLHIRLLQQASRVGTTQLDIVPCCYHLIATEQYQALSSQAQQSTFGAIEPG